MAVRIALVGDRDERVVAHRAIEAALRQHPVQFEWRHTSTLDSVMGYDGVWCVPASPYANEGAALAAIRTARETGIPFLGTCGGFQHAVLEFARNVLGWTDAGHEETATAGSRMVIAQLSCPLVEVERKVRLSPDSLLGRAYGASEIVVGYHCNYGLNAECVAALEHAGMRMTAWDEEGAVRGCELAGHPFFTATLFQPERAALRGGAVPIVDAFVKACPG